MSGAARRGTEHHKIYEPFEYNKLIIVKIYIKFEWKLETKLNFKEN